jgi:hypothetical protein
MVSYKKKRANAVIDTLFIIIILFVCAVVWIISFSVQKDLNDDIQASDMRAEGKDVMQTTTNTAYKVLDGGILFFLIGFWILALIASFMVDSHPIFFIVSLILLIAVLIVVIVLGNVFDDIFTTDFTGLSGYFPFTFFIFGHILAIAIVIGLSILGVMVAKPQ